MTRSKAAQRKAMASNKASRVKGRLPYDTDRIAPAGVEQAKMKLVISVIYAVLGLSTAFARDVLQPAAASEKQNPWFCHGLDCPLYDLLNKTDAYETRKYQPGALHVVLVRLNSILHRWSILAPCRKVGVNSHKWASLPAKRRSRLSGPAMLR